MRKDTAEEPTQGINPSSLDTRQLLKILTAVKKGDFSARMPIDQTGSTGEICHPVVIILDLKMPKIDGLEVLRQIKNDKQLNTIPVNHSTQPQ